MRLVWRGCIGCVLVSCLAADLGAQTPVTWPEVLARFQASNPTLGAGQLGIEESRAAETTALDGRILDNDDVVEGIVLLRKGAESDSTLKAIEAKVKELNDHILPPGVTVVPFLDRSDLVHYTTQTGICTERRDDPTASGSRGRHACTAASVPMPGRAHQRGPSMASRAIKYCGGS